MSSDSGPNTRIDPGNLWFACRVMLDFAYDSGVDVPPELTKNIIALDTLLVQLGADPIARINPALHGERAASALPPIPPAAATQVDLPRSAADLMHEVHAALSKLIKPATALTVLLSEPSRQSRWRFLDGVPLVVKAASVIAIVSALVFVVSAAFLAQLNLDVKAADVAASAAAAARQASAGAVQATKGTP